MVVLGHSFHAKNQQPMQKYHSINVMLKELEHTRTLHMHILFRYGISQELRIKQVVKP